MGEKSINNDGFASPVCCCHVGASNSFLSQPKSILDNQHTDDGPLYLAR